MPNLYKELHDRHQAEINAFPFGFAFSKEQFNKMMVERFNLRPTDTDKIYSIGGGGYIRKEDHQAMCDMIERHAKEKKDAIAADLTGEGYIYDMFVYELANHEYMITLTSDDTLEGDKHYMRTSSYPSENFARWLTAYKSHERWEDGAEIRANIIFDLDGETEKVMATNWNGCAVYSDHFNPKFEQ